MYTRDYATKTTKTYIFSTNDAKDLISESDNIFSDNANFIERKNGVLVLGAKLIGMPDS